MHTKDTVGANKTGSNVFSNPLYLKDFFMIEIEADDLLETPAPLLTKAEAVRLLDQLTSEQIAAGTVHSGVNVDFSIVIDGNVRDLIACPGRVNHKTWGEIPVYKQRHGKNHRLVFDRAELEWWFRNKALPVLIAKSEPLTVVSKVAAKQLLTQSMAAAELDKMRTAWSDQYGAILHPAWEDFNKLLTDNDRRQWVKGRERCGKPKGNRHLYGVIDCKKIGRTRYYNLEVLQEWFNNRYVPTLSPKVAA